MLLVSDSQTQPITSHVLHRLYTEVMILADEARAYFERHHENDSIAPELAVSFSCESLKVTTRLMHSIAWLLSEKAIYSGEIDESRLEHHDRELGYAPASDKRLVDTLPSQAQYLVSESEIIYDRLKRLSRQIQSVTSQPKPFQHLMLDRLAQAF